MRVSGPSLEQLDRRGDIFAALIRREIKATLDDVAPRISGVDDASIIRTKWNIRIDQQLADHVMNVWWESADDTHAQLVRASNRVDRARPQELIARLRQLDPTHPLALVAAVSIPRVFKSIADFFRVGVKNHLRNVGDLIWSTVREQIIEGNLAGESIDEIRDRIVATTDIVAPRAEVIARTEVIAASEAGSYEQMQATGFDATKEWLATNDGHTRPAHAAVNGEIVDMNSKFTVGGCPMDRPHDPTAPIELTVNCRCTLLWDIPNEEFLDEDEQLIASAAAFHLPGKHDQSEHGRKGDGRGLKAGKPLKITHALVHKKYPSDTTIAITKDGGKRAVWDGGQYDLQSKQDDGGWKTDKSAIKSKAYVAINEYASDWHEPIDDDKESDAPDSAPNSAPEPTPAVEPKTESEAVSSTTPIPVDKEVKAGKLLNLTPELMHEEYPSYSVIAVTKDGSSKLVSTESGYDIWVKTASGNWSTKVQTSKTGGYYAAIAHSDEWYTPQLVNPESDASTLNSEPALAGPKNYTNLQRAQVQTIFSKHNVKWHNDSKNMYDAALEVSTKHADLTMADALDIMDQSLTKKTGNPFRTKIEKFLQTKAGKQYAQEKGGSAPTGGTQQSVSPAVPPKSDVPQRPPLPRELSTYDANELQKRMNKADPPPWNAAQRDALRYYTGSAYVQINQCLRNTKPSACTKSIENRIKNIKKAMKPSTDDVVVYRKTNASTFGLGSPADAKNLVGKTVKDKGVVSTSISKGVWHGQLHIEIDAPKGSRMAWVKPISNHPSEDEIVLAPGTEFEVVSVTPHPNGPGEQIMKLRIVPGSGSL